MRTYELINPSDPYTFKARDIHVAGACAVMLSTAFGALDVETDEQTPVIMGWAQWLKENGIDSDWCRANAAAIADAYDSFLIGKLANRQDVESMLALIPEDKRQQWLAERQDRHRSSMNDIGTVAYARAKEWRKLAESQNQPTDKTGKT